MAVDWQLRLQRRGLRPGRLGAREGRQRGRRGGLSMGAVVTVEMVVSGAFTGPVVLLGVSLSTKDEPWFFRAIARLGSVLGGFPATLLSKGAASMVKRIPVSPERQAELREDFRRNVPADVQKAQLMTIPGHVFFLPNEVPGPIAATVLEAVARAESPTPAGRGSEEPPAATCPHALSGSSRFEK